MLIGSDLQDEEAARQEVESWVARNEYIVPDNARHLTVFENGVAVREWVLVERPMTTLTVSPEPTLSGQEPFWRNWRLRTSTLQATDGENVVHLYPKAA